MDGKPRSLFDAMCKYSLMLDGRQHVSSLAKDNVDLIQRFAPYRAPLTGHNGCVNSIQWSEDGAKILSGGDDQRILIFDPFRYENKVLVDYKTSHKSNIFSAKFLPCSNDEKVISSSGDGEIMYTDLNSSREDNSQNCFRCHSSTCYEVLTVTNEPFTFYSCGEDGTVRYYDLRVKQNCNCLSTQRSEDILIQQRRAVTSMSVSPRCPYELAIGAQDSVKIYDRRKLGSWTANIKDEVKHGHIIKQLRVPELHSSNRSYRITSVAYSSNGMELLASFSSENIYLFSVMDNDSEDINWENGEAKKETNTRQKKLRLRGDWSDTGPQARPANAGEIGQARPTLQNSLMERMTLFLSQMLNEFPDSGRTDEEHQPSTSRLRHLDTSGLAPSNPDTTMEGQNPNESGPNVANENNDSRRGDSEPGFSLYDDGGITPEFPVSTDADIRLTEIALQRASEQTEDSSSDLKLPSGKVLMKYTGHRNARTMIKEANFWGNDFIMSGSDCGHAFFWEKKTGKLVFVIEADSHVVNCIQAHPSYPLLAVSGIDYTVKLFAPLNDESSFDQAAVETLINRNKIMLEETKDTITVPAAFMIRMLTTLNHIRRSSAPGAGPSSSESEPT